MANSTALQEDDFALRDTPRAVDFFAAITLTEEILIIVSTILTICIVSDYIASVFYILNKYRTPTKIKYRSLQILAIYPAVAAFSLIGVYIPRAALLTDLLRSVVVTSCILQFTSLITHYYGGKHKMLSVLQGNEINLRNPPCCCCCVCLPKPEANARNVKRLRLGILQGFIMQPIILTFVMVLWLDGEYNAGVFSATDAFVYLTVLDVGSTLLCVYCFITFFKLVRGSLAPLRVVNKFFGVQLVLILTRLQGSIFDLLLVPFNVPPSRGILSTTILASAYFQMLLIVEMAILTLASRRAYRQPHEIVVDVMTIETETAEFEEKAVNEQAAKDGPNDSNFTKLEIEKGHQRPGFTRADSGIGQANPGYWSTEG